MPLRREPVRRSLLALVFVAAATLLASNADGYVGTSRARAATQATQALNAIQVENSNPGTPGWDDFSSVAQQDAISGYGSKISVNHGDSLDLYVTTTAASFTIDVFRTGWYAGVGARRLASLGSFPGVHRAIPTPDPVTGLVAATDWTKTTTLTIPSSWVTGVYLAKLSASNGNKSFIFFVVRNDGGTEPIAFQTSVTTYQAYNAWGGTSLYTNNTNKAVYKYDLATKVSFDRPFDPQDSNGAGHFLYYEYPFIRWAESQGYDLTYITDLDTHTNINPLANHRAFLSVGHDEYWTRGMRDNVTGAIANGMNAAFFSANTAYWQIRLEPNSSGTPNRVEVSYKDSATFNSPPGPDPQYGVNNSIVTTRWRDPPVNLPENSFIGVMYQDQVNTSYPYVVQNASNWIYAGTGFINGTKVPGIVGYEYDKVWNNGFSPPGLTVLSSSPVVGCCEGGGSSVSNSTLYTAPSGARVFASGTIQWAWGLDDYSATYVNAGIQKTTSNILNAFGSGAASPAPAVALSPTSLSFGGQRVGTVSESKTTTLTNSGNAPLTISSIGVTGANAGEYAQSNTCPSSPSTLAAGATCTISVTFAPLAVGSRSASVTITDNAAASPHSVGLSGTGTAPAATLTPVSLGFGSQIVGTTSAAQTATLANTGTAPLTIGSIGVTGTNAGDYGQTSACPATLAAGASCSISVTFAPTASGSRVASLSVTDDAAGSPHAVALTGTGTVSAPAVGLTPTALTFSSQTVGTTSTAKSTTLSNTGSAPLTIGAIGLAGTNASDFAQTNTCPPAPATLAAGATCTVSVTFTPAATGARSASVTISDDAGDSPQAVTLSGTGAQAAPAVTLAPTSLNLGSQRVGTSSASQSTALTNSGSAPLSISMIAIVGVNAAEFGENSDCPISPTTLAAGSSCTISATFTPSATGSRSASISITDDAANSPQAVPLTGSGTAPGVTLTPSSLSFGVQAVGTTSAAQSATLRNSGTAPMTLTSVSVTGANAGDFAQTNGCPVAPATLAANATCTISVTFTPRAAGARSASVTIDDDAAGSPHAVTLTGSGGTSAVAFDRDLGANSESASGKKATLTTTAAAAPGSRVFVFVNWKNASRTLASVTGGGLTWTIDRQAQDARNFHGAIASATAPTGLAAGTVITANFSGPVTKGLIAAASFTGIASASPLDASGSNVQAGVAAWTASVTTTNANDLVLGWSGINAQATSTATAPNVEIHDVRNSAYSESATSAYRIESTAGVKAVNGTWSQPSGATANITVVAAYRAG